MIGQEIGQYRVIEQIGLGGMATVYKAYQASMDRHVALKVLPHHFMHDPTFLGRFEREARTIAKLEHVHILPVHDYGHHKDVPYLVMRYVEGGALSDMLRQHPEGLPLTEAERLIGQIASALDYAHQAGVIHRDVKPSNVLLDQSGNVLLTDFGIAKIAEATVQFTGQGTVGTPAYMSPEQGTGRELTPATDVYSLGVVLFEMLTGRVPFIAETPIAVINAHIYDPLPLPRSLRPDLPEAVERVLLKALAKAPEYRYRTAGEMAAALSEAIRAERVAPPEVAQPPPPEETVPRPLPRPGARPPPTEAPAARPARRGIKPLWIGIGGVGATIALLAIIVVLAVIGSAQARSNQEATAIAQNATATARARPTATPRPTATKRPPPTPTPGPSPEVQRYLSEQEAVQMEIAEALIDLGAMGEHPDPYNATWVAAVSRQTVTARSKIEKLAELDVPPEMAEYHSALLDGYDDISAALDYFDLGLATYNETYLEVANGLVESGGEKIDRASGILDEYLAQFE